MGGFGPAGLRLGLGLEKGRDLRDVGLLRLLEFRYALDQGLGLVFLF